MLQVYFLSRKALFFVSQTKPITLTSSNYFEFSYSSLNLGLYIVELLYDYFNQFV